MMLRTALRTAPRRLRLPHQASPGLRTRHIGTTAAPSRGTWKGAAVRWSAAVAAVYWYNTSPLFADEMPVQTRPHLPAVDDDEAHQKLEDILTEKRLLETENARTQQPQSQTSPPSSTPAEAQGTSGSARSALAPSETSLSEPTPDGGPDPIATAASANALEEEAGNQGAFDPETGEINWDCPCLGGMADGPCGEQFKAAFSCFVYSKEEPKGMDCIDKFQGMQDCFREHPDIYGEELRDDEEAEAQQGQEGALARDASAEGREAAKGQSDAAASRASEKSGENTFTGAAATQDGAQSVGKSSESDKPAQKKPSLSNARQTETGEAKRSASDSA